MVWMEGRVVTFWAFLWRGFHDLGWRWSGMSALRWIGRSDDDRDYGDFVKEVLGMRGWCCNGEG